MHRRWRVRHSYPKPVVELVSLLMPLCGVREISRLLDIPKSVIYRWRARNRTDGPVAGNTHDVGADTIATLIARCDELGFGFTERLHTASSLALPLHAARRRLNEAAARRGISLHATDTILNPSTRNGVARRDGLDDAGTADVPAAPMDSGEIGQGYASAARRERFSRGVRSRLEAVRQMIDTEYYLDIDSRTLAETAQMSRHHFIRMFSGMFGMSPHQYLTRARIGAAKRLLLASREPIEVIAVGVGFRSGPSLNRAFKQVEGATVSKYSQTASRNRPAGKSTAAVPAPDPVRSMQQDD